MANLVLYRKYRPQTFGEVIGQEHVVQTLKNAVSMGLISHAYLFAGPRGSGKTSIARLLAKAVNCKNPKNGEPCNTCTACQEINAGRAIDLVEIDAASNRGIDEIRELKEGIAFSPVSAKYKVFIVDESHQLTKEAANALLKTLEEPPSHAIFILATTEAHKMIPTIASRCQRFDFRRLSVKQIVERLELLIQKEGAKVESEALTLIALHSSGSLRDAEGILEKVLTYAKTSGKEIEIEGVFVRELLGIVDIQVVASMADLILLKKAAEALAFLNKNLQEGVDPYEFAKNFLEYVREALFLKISPSLETEFVEGLSQEQKEKLQKQALEFDAIVLQKTIESFMEAENQMKYASIVQLPLELAIIDSCMG
ncbi:MAG: DNA polymerase III subunit gamma/tau [Parcubacteria group bacterium Greene0714_21]|nr:MAG: DNA polymerase III subunit gamma/tau [Parcubacteria group bacterium Greene0416_39]TSC97168.1 MAG: DNA polymerase III subunit gamma/tau [Parcubacteria group bacterium Greene1014_47]TSD03854.1 MAG: DNA polymerase III subunit gamma/tau [Parcubacteria group bacterium Greene0714_21]